MNIWDDMKETYGMYAYQIEKCWDAVQTSTDNLRMRFDDHVCHDQKLSLYNFKNEVALHDVPESWEAISSSVYVLTIHGYRQFCCKLIYHFCHSNILQLYTY